MTKKLEDLGEIWMNDEFNAKTALELREGILEHAAVGEDFPVIIYINSYGGSVDALNSIFDTIDSIPNEVITVCAGTAMSCGAFLLAYGDERYIGKHSRVMLHQVSHGAWGTVIDTAASVKEAKRLNRDQIRKLANRTGKEYSEISALLEENVDKYFNATEAKDYGLVDHIGMPRIQIETTYKVVK